MFGSLGHIFLFHYLFILFIIYSTVVCSIKKNHISKTRRKKKPEQNTTISPMFSLVCSAASLLNSGGESPNSSFSLSAGKCWQNGSNFGITATNATHNTTVRQLENLRH